jgi:membrane dipeptidase
MRINRREFGKLMGLSAAGVAGLNMRAFAQAAETQPGGPYPDNFRAIHDGMIKIDGACPMIAQTLDPTNFNLWLDGGVNTMSLTVGGANKGAETTTNLLKWVAEQIMTRPELMLVRTTEDIRTAKRDGKLGIMFHFQGPSSLGSDIERVWYYKGLGLGVLQMAYNTRNMYANGITERVDGGLSLMGQKLVKACNEARLIVDVSHTAEKSALDTIEASSEPVIMSHANARGQIDSPRNVSDDLIKAIAANGGFVGAVAYPPFVSTNQKPTMDDMVAMIDYMVQLVGPDHVTMGLDFDATTFGVMDEDKVEGIYNALVASGAWDPSAYPPPPYYYPEGMELPNTLYNLTGALLARGYSEEDLAKIWGGNWLRVMDEVWGDPTAEEIVTVETPFHQH